MAIDTELPDMAVDSEGPAEDEDNRILLQAVEALRIIVNQVNNPDPEPEMQDSLMRKHRDESQLIQAKRQKTQEMKRVTARKRQEPFRTVTWNLAGQSGTVPGLRENDDAVGCDAPAVKPQQA